MITGVQIRAARALLGMDQQDLADRAGLSLPTIQRMESSGGIVRGNVDSLTKVFFALEDLGIELIGEGSASATGGRGVRLRGQEVRRNANSDVAATASVVAQSASEGLRSGGKVRTLVADKARRRR
jgi:transcriptional regulator with XRE-family HTH domain